MKKKLFISVFAFLIISCASNIKPFEYGENLLAAHKVSVYELLGESNWYDNQPVEVAGVANFEFFYDGSSGLYASEPDWENNTYAWVVLDLENTEQQLQDKLIELNGEYITVSGVFHAYERKKLPTPEDSETSSDTEVISICKGICGAVGYISVKHIIKY